MHVNSGESRFQKLDDHLWLFGVPETLKSNLIFIDMKRDRQILQRYLDNDLSERELTRFEQELSASQELLADLNLSQEVDEAISDTEILDFRSQLNQLRNETRRSEPGRRVFRFSRPWHYAASAAVALLVAIGLATVLGRPLSNKDLFVKYIKPYELVLTNRSQDAEIEKFWMSRGGDCYINQNYTEAAEWYIKVLEANPNYMEAELYLGISHMESLEYVDASNSFETVIEQNDNLYIQPAEWYLAGCFLATNETDRARRQLAMIASSNGVHKDEAARMLKRMKR